MKRDNDISSLEHTAWRCQYHIVFAPKYRRMEIYGAIREDIGVILRKLCQQKGVEIIEAQACPDHIHMLVSIPPKYSVSQIMGYLKGKSSLMIFDRHEEYERLKTERTDAIEGIRVLQEELTHLSDDLKRENAKIDSYSVDISLVEK